MASGGHEQKTYSYHPGTVKVQSNNRKEINKLVHSIKNLKLSIADTKGFGGAEVSTGGVDTSEVNPENMESKIVPNLFLQEKYLM